MSWEPPSERVCELMRQGADKIVNGSHRWLDELNEATLASLYLRTHTGDPALTESIRQGNRSNLMYWARANVDRPGEPVPANLQTEQLVLLRTAVQQGMDEKAIVEASRIGQNVAWQTWMRTAMELTSDPTELRELLDVSARSITSFIDATVAQACHQVQLEHGAIAREKQEERRKSISEILDGTPLDLPHVENLLGYRFGQSHTAAVVWVEDSTAETADLDRASEALLHIGGRHRSLSVSAGNAIRWVWLSGTSGPHLADVAAAAVSQLPAVRVAVGSTAAGLEGFRRSHLDAVNTQRMVAIGGSARQIASFADVELIALITSDAERADRFINHTLGEFKSADAELQRTVLTFVHEQCNASRTAARLFTHRNTLSRRLTRANELLPQPLEVCSVRVAVALEALRWRSRRELAADRQRQ